MKNYYLVVSIKENEKNYAYVVKANKSNNLLSTLEIKNIETANICETKKEAEKIVTVWNEAYKNNGTYIFDDAPKF